MRCGTSVAANYRAVCRARSKAEFVARMGIVAEEATKAFCGSNFWRKQAFSVMSGFRIILKEATELVAIFSTSLKTAKGNR